MRVSTGNCDDATRAITPDEIVSLIESPELREYLLENLQLLSGSDYARIIGAAPVGIGRKREMLGRLALAEDDALNKTTHWYDPREYVDYIDGCIDALKAVDGNKRVLLISEISFNGKKKGSTITHGPFPVTSWSAALAAMKTYVEKWSDKLDLSSSYWLIELFDLADNPEHSYPYDGFLQPDYSYYATASGEIQYICREEEGQCGEALDCLIGEVFGPWFKGAYVGLPTPYAKGDILKIDCRPWQPGPVYCLVANSKLDCLYFNGESGQICSGSIPYGSCFPGWAHTNLLLSPVFRARKVTGALPEACESLRAIDLDRIEELLEKLSSREDEEEPLWLDIFRHRLVDGWSR